MTKRRDDILKFIEARGEVSLGELSAEFGGWSEMTLRRDLASLAQENLLILTRGGARSIPYRYTLSEDIYSEREQRNRSAKQRIAQAASRLVEEGTGIFIDSGTTAMAFARALPDCHLVVITSAPNVAMEVAMRKEKPSVIMLGGTFSRKEISIADPEVPEKLEKLNIETAFMTASAYDLKCGFTVGTQLGAMLKKAVIRRAKRVVMMLDSSKVGTLLPFTFAMPGEVDVLVTDGELPAEIKEKLTKEIASVI